MQYDTISQAEYKSFTNCTLAGITYLLDISINSCIHIKKYIHILIVIIPCK